MASCSAEWKCVHRLLPVWFAGGAVDVLAERDVDIFEEKASRLPCYRVLLSVLRRVAGRVHSRDWRDVPSIMTPY